MEGVPPQERSQAITLVQPSAADAADEGGLGGQGTEIVRLGDSAASSSAEWVGPSNSSTVFSEATHEASPAERQEELLRNLSKLTKLRLSETKLSADFRLQLQMLECSVQQQRTLQQLADQQHRTTAHLEGLHGQGAACHALVQQRLESVQRRLEQVSQQLNSACSNQGHSQASLQLDQRIQCAPSRQSESWSQGNRQVAPIPRAEAARPTPGSAFVRPCGAVRTKNVNQEPQAVSGLEAAITEAVFVVEDEAAQDVAGRSQRRHQDAVSSSPWCGKFGPASCIWLCPANTARPMFKPKDRSDQRQSRRMEASVAKQMQTEGALQGAKAGSETKLDGPSAWCRYQLPPTHPFRILITSNWFNLVCAVVISCNAATIGLQTQDGIVWAQQHVGDREKPQTTFLRQIGYFYVCFYMAELVAKLFCFRLHFFTNEDWKWNLFDLSLVVLGIYDLLGEVGSQDKNANITWIRLLRLVRMLRMLRVVRVMRFFRVLRMMVSSIAGSMMSLLWSILMLLLMKYIFGLCFLQIISGYLSDTPKDQVDIATLEAVEIYWANVPQAIITLYYSVTGGADWENLALPIAKAGMAYHCLFMFYIAFTAFVVLNVLTGFYVGTAAKVSEMDREAVDREIKTNQRKKAFRDFVTQCEPPEEEQEGQTLSWSTLEEGRGNRAVLDFLALAGILSIEECLNVFNRLDTSEIGSVDCDEFIKAVLELPSSRAVNLETDNPQSEFSVLSDRLDELARRLATSSLQVEHHSQTPAALSPAPSTVGNTTSFEPVSAESSEELRQQEPHRAATYGC